MPERNPVVIIIPALDEARSISGVVSSVRSLVDGVIVVDNGSTDQTATIAAQAGAVVISEPVAGYGRACLRGIAVAREMVDDDPDTIIVFMDADAADDPADLRRLTAPISGGIADFVVGSRLKGTRENGALTLPQRAGNRLACTLMRLIWQAPFTDLGPFRAVRLGALKRLDLDAMTYGWTVQMQVRALKIGLRSLEVPVHYRRRIGISKISGTVRGVLLAGYHILAVIAVEALGRRTTSPGPRSRPRREERPERERKKEKEKE